jgi:hypothetical protein
VQLLHEGEGIALGPEEAREEGNRAGGLGLTALLQLDPVSLEARQRREPGGAPAERILVGGWLGRGPVVLTGARDGTQAGMARAPETQAMADQVAEGEQDRVEPL